MLSVVRILVVVTRHLAARNSPVPSDFHDRSWSGYVMTQVGRWSESDLGATWWTKINLYNNYSIYMGCYCITWIADNLLIVLCILRYFILFYLRPFSSFSWLPEHQKAKWSRWYEPEQPKSSRRTPFNQTTIISLTLAVPQHPSTKSVIYQLQLS